MELLMKNIHMCRQGKQAGLPVTLEEDFNVPDVRPDVEQIIQSKERIVVEQTRAENGRGGHSRVSGSEHFVYG